MARHAQQKLIEQQTAKIAQLEQNNQALKTYKASVETRLEKLEAYLGNSLK